MVGNGCHNLQPRLTYLQVCRQEASREEITGADGVDHPDVVRRRRRGLARGRPRSAALGPPADDGQPRVLEQVCLGGSDLGLM